LLLGLAALAAVVAVVAGAYGGWLVATPDEESTRQNIGFALVALAVAATVLAIFFAYAGSRPSGIRTRP
jgi:hypothetical protein